MEVVHSVYNYKKSRDRIDSILKDESDTFIENNNKFPSESLLRFNGGRKVNIDVIAVDIRQSTLLSELLSENRISILTKIYRAYISEVIAVMKSNENIQRVYIEGDGIWAVFESNDNSYWVFDTAVKISSIVETINSKLRDMDYPNIKIGIGLERGKSFYVKAGYKGTGINQEVWVGNIVNKAFKLCSLANKGKIKELVVSKNMYQALEEKEKKRLKYNRKEDIYHTRLVDADMKDWLKKNSSTYMSCTTNYCYYKVEKEEKKKWFGIW